MPLSKSSPINESLPKTRGLGSQAIRDFGLVREGQRVHKEYLISNDVYRSFLKSFGDTNRLHVDESFAKSKGFLDKVMHGAIINGFISNFIGVEFPGPGAVIHSVSVEYKRPSYLNDRLRFEAIVDQHVQAVRTLVLKFDIYNQTRDYLCAKARVQVGQL